MPFDLWSPVLKLSLCSQPPVGCSFTGMLKQRLGRLRKAVLLWVLSPSVGLWVLLVRRPCWYLSTAWPPLTPQSEPFSSRDSRPGFPCSFAVCPVLESWVVSCVSRTTSISGSRVGNCRRKDSAGCLPPHPNLPQCMTTQQGLCGLRSSHYPGSDQGGPDRHRWSRGPLPQADRISPQLSPSWSYLVGSAVSGPGRAWGSEAES